MDFSTAVATKAYPIFRFVPMAKNVFAVFHFSVTNFPYFIESASDEANCQNSTDHNYCLLVIIYTVR